MSADDLLLWMSARREGSWQQFRAAVEELHLGDGIGPDAGVQEDSADPYALPLYQTLRLNLQRLGHAEFFSGAGNGDWRVAPPALAVMDHRGGCLGIVAGARFPRLLAGLNAAGFQSQPLPACPDQLRLHVSDRKLLEAAAAELGLLYQPDAPRAILSSLPAVDDPGMRQPAELPAGADWRVERFSIRSLRWRPAERTDALSVRHGLFRFSLRHQRHILICEGGRTFQIPGQVGKYAALSRRRRNVLRYAPLERRLSSPAGCRPPFLIERALILCSGQLPAYEVRTGEAGVLHYSDIPRPVAELACMLLRQRFAQ